MHHDEMSSSPLLLSKHRQRLRRCGCGDSGDACRPLRSEAPALASVASNLPGGLASYIKVKPIGHTVGIVTNWAISLASAATRCSHSHPARRGGAIFQP